MEIKPFKAYRFNPETVGEIGACVAPPYDIIDEHQQQKLHDKSPYNIARIIKPKSCTSDNHENNCYTRAANKFNNWIQQHVLKQDDEDAVYAYLQDFGINGRRLQRLSFIALAHLEKLGRVVRPHEQTLNDPKIDRLNLKRATRAGFGLPFCLYDDDQHIADKIIEQADTSKPLIKFVDDDHVRHRLCAITDKNQIYAIRQMMLDKTCIIADGHHRYETALLYRGEVANPAADYLMIAFTNTRHDGLLVLATHRLVKKVTAQQAKKLLDDISTHFNVNTLPFDSTSKKNDARVKMLESMKLSLEKQNNSFGIYIGNGAFYVADLKDQSAMDVCKDTMSEPSRKLDVSVLHKLILERHLGIDSRELAAGRRIEYLKDKNNIIDRIIRRVDTETGLIAFFMNPPAISQIQSVAEQGEKMPQKSTFFHPKIYTGLTIYKY